jgi:hypothetical protein
MDREQAYNRYYRDLISLGADERSARSQAEALSGFSAPRSGSGRGGFGGALAAGSRAELGATVGALGSLTGGQATGFGRGLQEAGRNIAGEFEPTTGAERAGYAIGRVGTGLGTALVGGGLALRAARGVPAVARALESGSRLKRGAAYMAAGAPIDVLQGAQYEDGILLPGRAGSILENVAISGAAGAILPPVRRGAQAAAETREPLRLAPGPEPFVPRDAPETRARRLIPRWTTGPVREASGRVQQLLPPGREPFVPRDMPELRAERLLPRFASSPVRYASGEVVEKTGRTPPDWRAAQRIQRAADRGETARTRQEESAQRRIERALERARERDERRLQPTGRVRGGRVIQGAPSGRLEPEELARRRQILEEARMISDARVDRRLAEAAGSPIPETTPRVLGPEDDPGLFARLTKSLRPRGDRPVPPAFESEAGRVRPSSAQFELFSALGGAGIGALGGAIAGSQEGDVQQAGLGSILGGALGGALARGLGARGLGGARDAFRRIGELSPRVSSEAAEQTARASEDLRPGGVLDQIRVATGPRQLPKEETLLNGWQRTYTDVFDANAPILKVARSVGKETAEKLDDYIAVSAGYGKAAEQLITDELTPLFRSLYEQGGEELLQKVRQAAIARRAIGSGLNIGLTPEQLRAATVEINSNPVIRDATDRLHNFFRRLLEERRAAGLISEADYEAIVKSDDYYTPFMVDFFTLGKNPNAKAGGNWNVTDKGVRAIIRDPNFERSFAITDPFEVAISQAVTTMRDVGRARVMGMIDELVDSPLGKQFIKKKAFNPAMPMGSTGTTFQAIVNGKRVAYEVSDPDLLRSIAGQSDLSQNVLMDLSRRLAAIKRGGIVAPPDFALLNMLRDMSAYAIQRTDSGRALTEAGLGSLAGMGVGLATAEEGDDLFGRVLVSGSIGAGLGMVARPAAEIMQAVGDIVGNRDIYKEWLRRGGSSEGFYVRQSPKEADKILRAMKQAGISTKDVVTPARWYDALMFIGSVAEQAPRLARAKSVVGQDLVSATPDMWAKAIREGQDISVRFARKGGSKLTRDVASITPFWNAQLQGWVKVGQMVTNPRVAAQAGAIITAPSVALWYVNKDNPEYWERPQWERDLFWLVPKGDGGFYRVPKPFQIGTVFATLPERLLSYAAETGQISSAAPRRNFEAGQAVADALRIAVAEPVAGTVPIPAIADLALSQAVNRDFFTGREIVPQAYRGLPGEMQAAPRTSAIARAVGQATGISPLRTDKFIRDVTGTGGTRISEAC